MLRDLMSFSISHHIAIEISERLCVLNLSSYMVVIVIIKKSYSDYFHIQEFFEERQCYYDLLLVFDLLTNMISLSRA